MDTAEVETGRSTDRGERERERERERKKERKKERKRKKEKEKETERERKERTERERASQPTITCLHQPVSSNPFHHHRNAKRKRPAAER